MPLVDYGISDESDQESDNEVEAKPSVIEKPDTATKTSDEDIAPEKESDGTLFSALPKPKTQLMLGDENSLKNLLLNKSTKSILKQPKGAVKITIPSLSEFADEEDAPKPPPKKFKSSSKSALFSVLPPPKNNTVKEVNRTLIPNSIAKKKTQAVINSYMKQPKPQSTEDDDQAEIPSLMFSSDFLSPSSNPIPSVPLNPAPSTTTANNSFTEPEPEPEPLSIGNIPLPDEMPEGSSGEIPVQSGDLELDDRALQILLGNKKKRQQIPMEVIDISGKDIMPDSKEWLLKQFQEDQPTRSSSSRRGGPSTLSKRKHQITYLAYQAKANELELKNQWANNRMTRKQTQQKYGF